MLLGTITLLSLTGRHPTESRNLQVVCVWCVCVWVGGWVVCSCVICVFFSVRKSCHFTTVFLVGRYFYLHVFTLSLGLWIFFFQSGPHFSIRGGEQRGLDPLPPGFNLLPPPILFLPTPAPFFFLFFLPGTPPKIKIFFFAPPQPIFRQKPPYPHPLNSSRPSDAYMRQ